MNLFKKNIEFITVFGSARTTADENFYKNAELLGKELAKNGFGIITGGGSGIMEAVNKGAFSQHGISVGLNILLPQEQDLNRYCTHSKTYKNLSKRKQKLIKNSKFFIIMPGGFGTLDELFEILTLSQTKLRECEIIFYNKDFWSPLFDFFKNRLIKHKVISQEDLNLYKVFDSIDEIVKHIKNNIKKSKK